MSDTTTYAVKASECAQMLELFVFLSKRQQAFTIEEYVDVGNVYKKLSEVVKDVKDPEEMLDLTKPDLTFIHNTLVICAERVPVSVKFYKSIGTLYEHLSDLLKEPEAVSESKQ